MFEPDGYGYNLDDDTIIIKNYCYYSDSIVILQCYTTLSIIYCLYCDHAAYTKTAPT